MVSIKAIHKFDCDVLIIGGGPSGSALAYYLAKKGIHVIVAEAQKFPRDKVCGDAVSPVALAELQNLGITATEEFTKANQVNNVSLFIGEEEMTVNLIKADNLPFHGRVIPRLILDKWISDAAKKAGAIYLEDARLSTYSTNEDYALAELKTDGSIKKLKTKVIIGADGSNSTVSRILNGSKPKESYQLLGLRAYYEGVNGPVERCDIHFAGDNFPGLFWFFPVGNGTANIGSAMIAKTLPRNELHVKTILEEQIKKNIKFAGRVGEGKMIGKVSGWPLTFRDPKDQITGERLLLVGDAAGLINPLSGDGIQYALLSARWASEVLTDCFARKDFSNTSLKAYSKKIADELAYDLALSDLLIQVTRNRTFTPLWMEVLLVLIKRAKVDKSYAAIIAGIFDGTLPSYKALDPQFILKSIMQGGIHIGTNTAAGIIKGPEYWMKKTRQTGDLATKVAREIIHDPRGQVKWLAGVVSKGLTVSSHVLKSVKSGK
ncbi:MAG: geranylgeranyl reductase family protein [Chitinophagaceae bacterium]